MKNRTRLSDKQWALIAPHLPLPAQTGRPRADDRRTLEAILHVLRSGCRWNDLPDAYGVASTTAWRRLRRWEEDGTWEHLWRALLRSLDQQEKLHWAEAFLDGSFVPAKGGQAVGMTRKGKGTKLMVVTDGEGIPVGFLLESAQKSEVRLAERTLETIRVGRRTKPHFLTCDRGYDSRAFRRYLRRRGIRNCIPMRRRPKNWKPKNWKPKNWKPKNWKPKNWKPKNWKARRGRPPVADPARYARRWKVERTFAWLLSNRRIVVRWEHHLSIYRGFLLIAMAMTCLNRLLQ